MIMAKIDEIKEILNTLRIAMSVIAGIIVILVGKIFSKFEKSEFDLIFWVTIVTTILVIFAEMIIIYNIAKKTKEIKDL
ncbi:hypothetical protein MNB_SM-7-656 [hydrothermal vent metagenome]|uniref:Uncharacterized protein n=1 Tax=hydrothermal vent metagenome TaxID=652676 RepID=A0A1W1BMT5_9ZZZZ